MVDESGAALKNAAVVLRHKLTGATRRASTNPAGEWSFDAVSPGRSWLGASFPGFADQGHLIELSSGQEMKDLELRLSIEALNQQVTVVSSSRVEESRDDSPLKVESVSREQIRNTGYERVSDVLSEVPGVVTRRGATATVGGEQIQGIDSRQVMCSSTVFQW